MQIKKFEAVSMAEALRAVRAELGSDAVILSTKEVRNREGVFGLLSRSMVEVTAAIDRPGPSSDVPVEAFHQELNRATIAPSAGHDARSDVAALARDIRAIRESIGAVHAAALAHQRLGVGLHHTWSDMRSTLEDLRGRRRPEELTDVPSELADWHHRLTVNGVDDAAAVALLVRLRASLSPEDTGRPEVVREAMRAYLREGVTVAGGVRREADRPAVVALVGPTGVGKTTTIAKLAARFVHEGSRVTLVTMDAYRVGAVEQLKTYAKILGAPVEAATSGAVLRRIVSPLGGGDVVLVDTAGRSHLNAASVGELNELSRSGLRLETHLVVAANTAPREVDDIVARFSVIPIDRLLVSKLDETGAPGAIFGAAARADKPLSYLASGQRVPEDLEEATVDRVADLVAG